MPTLQEKCAQRKALRRQREARKRASTKRAALARAADAKRIKAWVRTCTARIAFSPSERFAPSQVRPAKLRKGWVLVEASGAPFLYRQSRYGLRELSWPTVHAAWSALRTVHPEWLTKRGRVAALGENDSLRSPKLPVTLFRVLRSKPTNEATQ